MRELSAITSLSKTQAPGPMPSFSDYHLLWTVELVELDEPVGRSRLSKSLGLGEGVGRTIVERLRDKGLIRVARSGCSLTSHGRNVLDGVRRIVSRSVSLTGNLLGFGESNIAILVHEASHLVRSGIEERDASVKAGALGAMTLVFNGGLLSIPGLSENAEKDFPAITSQLLSRFKPRSGDVLLIVAADNVTIAELAIRAAVFSLLRTGRS